MCFFKKNQWHIQRVHSFSNLKYWTSHRPWSKSSSQLLFVETLSPVIKLIVFLNDLINIWFIFQLTNIDRKFVRVRNFIGYSVWQKMISISNKYTSVPKSGWTPDSSIDEYFVPCAKRNYIYMKCIFTRPSTKNRIRLEVIFSQITAGLNPEFSFSLTGRLNQFI